MEQINRELPEALLSELPTFELSEPHEGLLRLRRWITTYGGVRLTRNRAAAIACVEPHYFSALFHEFTGITFLRWRRDHRAACAVKVIASGICSIRGAMDLVGYQDRRSLERAVKRATGRTPAAFRPPTDQPTP